jgi:8-hydroxy-5-deazaflavin:NADPH oxidoreductase
MTTIGLLGSGHVGSNLAKAAIAHGYDVVISNSQGPETLTGLVQDLGPKARAATSRNCKTSGPPKSVAIHCFAVVIGRALLVACVAERHCGRERHHAG